MVSKRYSRNEALFGVEGQRQIGNTNVAIIGLGGLGSHVAQQLAYLGINNFMLVDDDVITESSLNRVVGAYDSDVVAKTPKIEVAQRQIRLVVPHAEVGLFSMKLESAAVSAALNAVDVVFGCLDEDSPRLRLTELCSMGAKPYFDLATDTTDPDSPTFGGR